MDIYFLIVPASSIIALITAFLLVKRINREEEGTELMKKIARAVKIGTRAYIKRQYSVVSLFFLAVFIILWILVFFKLLPFLVPFAFLTGGFFSGLSGYIGMSVATNSSSRTANAARRGLNPALRVAFSSGMVMGLVVVGLGLLDLSIWYTILSFVYRGLEESARMKVITATMINFGMGASAQALFARVGGGIFTKAADMGADLVGKVEVNIPEDDPRNPAVIADNVGDNVGDVAGMGADLYESYVDSIVASMTLAATASLGKKGVFLPMLIAALGILSSIIGYFFIRAGEKASQATLLKALRKGIYITGLLVLISTGIAVYLLLGKEHMGIYLSIITGLIAGILIGFFTEYFTSDHYKPTKQIAKAAAQSPAVVIVEGLGVGMNSTVPIVLTIGFAIILSYFFAGGGNFEMGLYGIGIAAVGMLSTLGITLASDAYGPVADNAGGNAQMAKLDPVVRERTDALDSLGNTTAATGKGFAIGSAALTALALIVAYRDEVARIGETIDLSLLNVKIVVGLFLGGMLVFGFSSFIIKAIGRTAGVIVNNIREQFKDKRIMEGEKDPDYAEVVRICTASAQKEMILPALTGILSPIVVGVILGIEGVVGLLVGTLVTGFSLAVMMANSGGAWDNAKKYIEKGFLGGKGTEAHKGGVIGDTVGDPLKDAAGPSLNILIKLMSMVSIVFLRFIMTVHIF